MFLSNFLRRTPWQVLLFGCLTLGLAPFYPPHVWEKLGMLFRGELVKAIDWFDLAFHGFPWVLLAAKFFQGRTMLKQITMKDLYERREALGPNEVILDVRTPEEFKAGHVKGSINISHEQIGAHIASLKRYETIYIHCRSGRRAEVASAELIKAGFKNLVCIGSTGMEDWIAAGYPVEKGHL